MNDGDGNHPQDEDVEYLERLLCEQIRTAHDTGFQRLQQSLHDAISGLERARKDLTDLFQRDFDKALKKLLRTVPDEVGQVVRDRLPGDYAELVRDAEELSSKVSHIVNILEAGSEEFQYLTGLRIALESYWKDLGGSLEGFGAKVDKIQAGIHAIGSACGMAFPPILTSVGEVQSAVGRIEDQTRLDSENRDKLLELLTGITARLEKQDGIHAETAEQLKEMVIQAGESSSGGLQLLTTLDRRIAVRDQVAEIGRQVELSKSSLMQVLEAMRSDLSSVSQVAWKVESDLTSASREIINSRATLDGRLLGIGEIIGGISSTAQQINREIEQQRIEFGKTLRLASEEHQGITTLISRSQRELQESVNKVSTLCELLGTALRTLRHEGSEASANVHHRFDDASAQISKLQIAQQNLRTSFEEHVTTWKTKTATLEGTCNKTYRQVIGLVAAMALFIIGVPLGMLLWWLLQR